MRLLRYRRLRTEWLGNAVRTVPPWLEALVSDIAKQLDWQGPSRIQVAPADCGPAVVGFLRPTVVLPESLLRRGSREQIRHVILHELAHIKRRDPQWTLFCLVVQLVYWFHPLVWLARRRLSTLREVCCDQTVSEVLSESAGYRSTLLHLARRLLKEPAPVHLSFIHPYNQLLTRLEWLRRPLIRNSPVCRAVTTVVILMLSACCIPLARPLAVAKGSQSGDPYSAQTSISIRGELRQEFRAEFSRSGTLVHPAAQRLSNPINGDAGDRSAEIGSVTSTAQPPPTSSSSRSASRLTPVDGSPPSLDHLPGCLPRRYLVLSLLAQQESSQNEGQEIQ